MPVAVANSFTYQKMHIKSDQHVSMMFSYHRSIRSIYSMELCVKLQDVGGSSSSSNNVEEMRNSGAGEGIPFLDIGRGRSPSFNAFVAPAQNIKIPDRRPFPNVHVAYSEGMADGLADSSEEDEIENDSGEEAEVVPETQPVQGERVIPSVVEPINVARVGALSIGTPDHYLHLSLGPMNSTNAEDIPSNYDLTGEMELEVGLKFLTKDAAMLAVKNYNIRRSAKFKVVESDHTRYVCRCKLFGDQCSWMESVESAYGYKVFYKKVWLAKQKAIARIYGYCDDSYNQLERYFNALQTFVPGTIADLQTRPYYVDNTLDRESVMFHQVFWSFPSCVKAFKHCKPLVSVDGTHLYGKYTGTLLMGIAQDGNNNILPIAFALVERENTDAWYFFLTNLRRHVATQPDVPLIFDRHVAIKAALEREGCGWEHNVYCVRHIASNFATNFKSKEAKRHLVSAAYSKTQEQAQYYLELISAEDPATSPAIMAWIRGLEPPKWLQHRDEGRRYGHMTTNLSECINSVMKGTRNLPVCAIVKSTYHRLNALFVQKGRQAEAQVACGQMFSQFLQKAILANREGITQVLVISHDRATSIFTVDEIAGVVSRPWTKNLP
ncbi:uncharacterized protein LOC107490832 [Arachis duranensis]|uniref:Uncharacterized protein LOC107490832 n=1 Tax=Arachis duranensis TaxID=130453 RepID=A0A6P4DJK7_ARADU|nr:uncharacterized protein LOC107490832 [Arachis duranensis]